MPYIVKTPPVTKQTLELSAGLVKSSISTTTSTDISTLVSLASTIYRSVNYQIQTTDGTYYNIKLFNTNAAPASAIWDGATATVVVSGGAITSATLSEGGAGYTNGETLYFDSSPTNAGGIGGSPGANVTIATANISIATSNYVQVTGISTGTDGYYRIDAVNNKSAVQIKKTASDVILVGQQVVDLGPVVEVSSVGTPATVEGITRVEFTCTGRHGLVKGNSLTITDTSNAKVGDFIVDSTDGVDKFTAITTGVTVTSAKYALKHGLSSNEAISSKAGENLDVRGLSVFDHETLLVAEASGLGSGSATIKVTLPDGSTTADSIKGRFPLGSYIQIEDEIMRVSNSALSGSNDTISVIRGALGTLSTDHANGSLIKKIKPLSFELRNSFFMPNPCDSSFEVLSNFKKDCDFDVFFAMSHGVHRGKLKTGKNDNREVFINKLIKKNKNLKFARNLTKFDEI